MRMLKFLAFLAFLALAQTAQAQIEQIVNATDVSVKRYFIWQNDTINFDSIGATTLYNNNGTITAARTVNIDNKNLYLYDGVVYFGNDTSNFQLFTTGTIKGVFDVASIIAAKGPTYTRYGGTFSDTLGIYVVNSNVGINKTSPAHVLDVNGGGQIEEYLIVDSLRMDTVSVARSDGTGLVAYWNGSKWQIDSVLIVNTTGVGVNDLSPDHDLTLGGDGSINKLDSLLFDEARFFEGPTFLNIDSIRGIRIGGKNNFLNLHGVQVYHTRDNVSASDQIFRVLSYDDGSPSAIFTVTADGKIQLENGTSIDKISADGDVDWTSDNEVPTSKAVQAWLGGTGNWTKSANDIYNNNIGNVGINNTAPDARLDVKGYVRIDSMATDSTSLFLVARDSTTNQLIEYPITTLPAGAAQVLSIDSTAARRFVISLSGGGGSITFIDSIGAGGGSSDLDWVTGAGIASTDTTDNIRTNGFVGIGSIPTKPFEIFREDDLNSIFSIDSLQFIYGDRHTINASNDTTKIVMGDSINIWDLSENNITIGNNIEIGDVLDPNATDTDGNVTIGNNLKVGDNSSNNVVIGRDNVGMEGDHSVDIGVANDINSNHSVGIGRLNELDGNFGVAIGYSVNSTSEETVGIGKNANVTASRTVGIGSSVTASAQNATVVGYNSTGSATYATTYGAANANSSSYSQAFGYEVDIVGVTLSGGFGNWITNTNNYAYVIGSGFDGSNRLTALADSSITFGILDSRIFSLVHSQDATGGDDVRIHDLREDTSALKNVVADASGNLRYQSRAHGTMYVYNSDTAQVHSSGVFGIDTAFNSSTLLQGITFDAVNHSLDVDSAGIYKVNASIGFSGTGSSTIVISVFVEGVEQQQVSTVRKLGVGGDVGSAAVSGLIYCSAGDSVDLRLKPDGNDSVTTQYGNLTLVKIE